MPSVTTRIPDSLRVSGFIPDPINTHAKSRLMAILSRPEIPVGPKPLREVAVHANFWLNAADATRLQAMAEAQDPPMSIGELITTLLVQESRATHESSDTEQVSTCPAELMGSLRALGLSERAEQTAFYSAIASVCAPDSSAEHKVLFAEAGTGTGKTLAYLTALHHFANANRGAIVAVAVPSHALMEQVLNEWGALTHALKKPIGATTALLGQGEFVSVQALQGILPELNDMDQCAAVEQWISSNGAARVGSLVSHRWTVASLREAAPTFAHLRSVTVDARLDDDDPGFVAYQQQWAKLPQCSVVFMTHSMLASLTWRRCMAQQRAMKNNTEITEATAAWAALPRGEREQRLYEIHDAIYRQSDDASSQALLPNLDLLIVDEAHQLDDAFARVLSRTVSIWALRRDLKSLHASSPRYVKGSDLTAMDQIWSMLRGIGSDDKTLMGEALAGVVVQLSNLLDGICSRHKSRDGDAAVWRRLHALSNSLSLAMKQMVQHDRLIDVMMQWSPDRAWPQLTVGRLSYAREMHYLWSVVAQRTCLVSGTLYVELPQLNCEAARRALNVPHDQMLTMTPVHAPWQYTPVTACVVGAHFTAGGRPRFVRPRSDDETPEAALSGANSHVDWINDLSGYIIQAWRDGAGGMLVLGTAFRDLEALSQQLSSVCETPVLCHRPGISLVALRERFISMADDGKRPILLAAGSAWTGFDLHSKVSPDACTDLVILNAPFGATTRTLAREARLQQKRGFHDLVAQVTVLVRQGIGRLVRSPNTPNNRRIHWLDARIHQTAMAGMLTPVRRVLSKYRQLTVG